MDCPQCGAPLDHDASGCPVCAPSTTHPPLVSSPETPNISVAAIRAETLGLLSMITCGLTGPFGIILGIIALVQIRRSQGRLRGTDSAIAGLVLSCFFTWLSFFLCFHLTVEHPKAQRPMTQCLSQQKQLAMAATLYAQEHNDVMPSRWSDFDVQEKILRCPVVKRTSDGQNDYGYNRFLIAKPVGKIAKPEEIVLTADGGDAEHFLGSVNDIAVRHTDKHRPGYDASFVDGHVEFIKAGSRIRLR